MAVPKYLRANRKHFLYTLCWQLGFFAAGVAMVLLINRFFNEDLDYACMGTLMALCGILTGGAMQLGVAGSVFRLTVLMGETRRYYLLWNPLVTALLTLQGWLTAYCLYNLETLLYGVLYPGYESGLPVGDVFRWWAVLLSAVILSIVCLFIGALQVKFGQKGFMIFWFVFWFGCMLIPRGIDSYQSGRSSLLARAGGLVMALAESLTPVMWIGVGIVLLVCALAFSVWVYLRAEVRI